MNPHFERARLLYHQGRYDMAEVSLRMTLAESPDFAEAHTLLALCLAERQDWSEATAEAQRAIGLAPDDPYGHYALARVNLGRNRIAEAQTAAMSAVELDPANPDYHCLLGLIYLDQSRWKDALNQADEGLRNEGEHNGCTNLRAMALVKLGRKDEADRAIEGALARDPDNAFSHANQGWTSLNQNDPNKAIEHFREALRLNPMLEYAQAGMIEALKARYLFYRLMLRWFLWMSRLAAKWQFAIIIGLFLGTRMIGEAAERNREFSTVLWTIWGFLVAFAVMTWLSVPLSNLLLMLNRNGRYLLSREKKLVACLVGVFLLVTIFLVVHWLTCTDKLESLIRERYVASCGFFVIVIVGLFNVPNGKPRWAMTAVALGLAAYATYGLMQMRHAIDNAEMENSIFLFRAGVEKLNHYLWGCIAFSMGTNILSGMRFQKH